MISFPLLFFFSLLYKTSKKAKIIKISDDLNNEDESVMSIEEIKSSLDTEVNEVEKPKTRVKYLHFDKTECKRPPYYGTWRKESKKIRPRNPFVMDEVSERLILMYFCVMYWLN